MTFSIPVKIGLVNAYGVNRPLTDEERANHLHQKKNCGVPPDHKVSVIKMNSTYLECVDKFFWEKGDVTFKGMRRVVNWAFAFIRANYCYLHAIVC